MSQATAEPEIPPVTSVNRFPTWRRLRRPSHVHTQNLRLAISHAGMVPGPLKTHSDLFEELLEPVKCVEEVVGLVNVPAVTLAHELDRTASEPSYQDALEDWMKVHDLDYLPFDVAPILRAEYPEQRFGEYLIALTKSPVLLKKSGVKPFYFVVANDHSGRRLADFTVPSSVFMAHKMPVEADVLFCRR